MKANTDYDDSSIADECSQGIVVKHWRSRPRARSFASNSSKEKESDERITGDKDDK